MSIERARTGDERAFAALVEPHRRELQLHCYRMLGSLQDAEDLVQETLLAAWRGLGGFEQRASLRAWLYRIATNRCLNALRERGRRPAVEDTLMAPPPTRYVEPSWLEPYPDSALPDLAPGPEARYEQREATQLAFVAGLQQLPERQRAALVLRDVLGFRTEEVAAMLDVTPQSVKGALQRARATLDERVPDLERAPLPDSPAERELVARFSDAFEAGDTARVVALLTDDGAADDAAAAARVHRPRGDRGVPRPPRRGPRRAARAAPDTRERPAGVRLLPALACVGLARADAERRADRGDHGLLRPLARRPVRPAAPDLNASTTPGPADCFRSARDPHATPSRRAQP